MKNFKNLLYKDFLLLIRDFWGVVLLFMMPWALVMLMTYLQESTFRSVNEVRIPLYLLNNDNDSLGFMVSRQILESNIFKVTTEVDGRALSVSELEEAIAQGDFMIGVIIPANTTARLRENVRQGVMRAFNGDDDDAPNPDADEQIHDAIKSEMDVPTAIQPLEIKLLIDPTAKMSFRTSLIQAVRENALTVQNQLLLSEITRQVNRIIPISVNLNIDTGGLIVIDESYAQAGGKARIIPNSTQHNVPAWSMFAIFFIVISLSGNMIREREIGCFNRMMTMPCSFHQYVLSKVGVYLGVCLLQLTLITVTGMYIMPLYGLPVLKLGHSVTAMIAMSVSSSLAAIGYGLAIGSIARTNQQASVFGAVSVIILAAIGGVWIPIFLMPRFMQIVSKISPLNWGLNGFNEIFVRDGGFLDILPYFSASILFFIITLLISYQSNRYRRM